MSESVTHAGLAGIFDGFEAYRSVTPVDIQDALKTGLVAVDTNVLLNLYRYDDAAREDLLKVFAALGDRLFVPHQVMLEFWMNRESASRDRATTARVVLERLDNTQADADRHVREWANRLGIAETVRNELLERLSGSFEAVSQSIETSAGDTEPGGAGDTASDTILSRLETLLQGKVGPALPTEQHTQAVKEGLRRVDQRIPPGFKDRKKEGDLAASDYLVWNQCLLEARRRGSVTKLTFVTGDASDDDWYRKESGAVRGPHFELYAEAEREAGVRLFMLRPPSLVFHAQAALELEIEKDTVQKIARSDDTVARPGWTFENAIELLTRLDPHGSVQREVIMRAIANGGFVSREEVYTIGGYEPDRTLRDFTRPARRVMQEMQDAGVLSEGVDEPLTTIYDPKHSYVVASGFRVPSEMVDAVRGASPHALEVDKHEAGSTE